MPRFVIKVQYQDEPLEQPPLGFFYTAESKADAVFQFLRIRIEDEEGKEVILPDDFSAWFHYMLENTNFRLIAVEEIS